MPTDPRDAQIAALRSENIVLMDRLAKQAGLSEMQEGLTNALQAQIAALREALELAVRYIDRNHYPHIATECSAALAAAPAAKQEPGT